MKNVILGLVIMLLFSSCLPKKLSVKENISNESVRIVLDAKKIKADSVNLLIPTEYAFNMKPKEIGAMMTYYIIDNKSQSIIENYLLYNKKSKKKIFGKEDLDQDSPVDIIIVQKDFKISRNQAQTILIKYKINQKINDLKFGDTIKTVPYSQFRKDNPDIIKRLNKIPDSVAFNFTKNDKKPLITKVKINW